MTQLLYSFTWPGAAPSIEQVRERFGLAPDEIDSKFGVIEIDPLDHLYSILIDPEAAERLRGEQGTDGRGAEGPFANPPIAPFGPPVEE